MASRKKNGGETAENTKKETQTVEVPAEDVTAVKEDGTETPLSEVIPELKGQTVEAEIPKEPEAAAQAVYSYFHQEDTQCESSQERPEA